MLKFPWGYLRPISKKKDKAAVEEIYEKSNPAVN
jgi:hypothetical protein